MLGYDRSGHGPPVLLLHGISHRRQVWHPVMRHLEGQFDTVALDLPGCGESPAPKPTEPYDVAALVAEVAAFCAQQGIRIPHMVGNSLGAAVALELGAQGQAASVTAIAPIGFATSTENAALYTLVQGMRAASHVPAPVRRAVAETRPLRALARRTLHADPRSPAARDAQFNTSVLEQGSPFLRLAPEIVNYSFTAPEVPCPVTIAWGDRDRILPPWTAQRAREQIPGAHLVRLLGCGHIPMADDPGAVAVTIRSRAGIGPPAQ